MQAAHLEIAKQLIETKYRVKILSIKFEDGSGRKFNVVTSMNPAKKQFVVI